MMFNTGQAVSNVFDGHKDLDGTALKGITRKCRVGLLTLFEVRGELHAYSHKNSRIACHFWCMAQAWLTCYYRRILERFLV